MIPYFDAHCDSLTAALDSGVPLDSDTLAARLDAGTFSKREQIYAVYGDSNQKELSGLLERAAALFVKSDKRPKGCLAIEGAEVIGCDPMRLKSAYEMGVRVTGITWNHANVLSGSCMEDTRRGLSEVGEEYLERALELGMFIDISHLSDSGAGSVISRASGRVLASHSNSRTVCASPRNLSDYLYLRLVEAGGMCGINLYTPFLKSRGQATVADVVAHIRYLAGLSGSVANLCLGCDFDGCDRLPRGIGSAVDLPLLYDAMIESGFSKQQTDDIFYNNLYNFMRR